MPTNSTEAQERAAAAKRVADAVTGSGNILDEGIMLPAVEVNASKQDKPGMMYPLQIFLPKKQFNPLENVVTSKQGIDSLSKVLATPSGNGPRFKYPNHVIAERDNTAVNKNYYTEIAIHKREQINIDNSNYSAAEKRILTLDNLDKFLTGLGIYSDTKLAILNLAKGEFDEFAIKFLNFAEKSSKYLGRLDLLSSLAMFVEKPTTKNLVKLFFDIVFTANKINPAISTAIGVFNASPYSEYVYQYIADLIDKLNPSDKNTGEQIFNLVKGVIN